MNISPNEAEEALESVQKIMAKTRRSIASSGAHISLIATGAVWMVGFICTNFISGPILVSIWIGLSIVGGAAAAFLGNRFGKRIQSQSTATTAKRAGLLWLLLAVYCAGTIAVSWPLESKQITFMVALFVLVGWLAMGLMLSISSIWPGLIIVALMIAGYFIFPGIFYLWMGILVGGGMIGLGIYIRSRW